MKLFYYFIIFLSMGCFSDFAQPEVLEVSPGNSTMDASDDTSVIIRFNKEMDSVQTNNSFTLSSTGGTISGYFSWSDNGKSMTFKPKEGLSSAKKYTVAISSRAEDKDGNDLKDNFTSVFYINSDITPPEVVLQNLIYLTGFNQGDATGVSPSSSIVLNFSEPVDLDSLYSGFTISPSVSGSYEWNVTHTAITFNPLYDLNYGTTYIITADTIKDKSGNKMLDKYTFNFIVGDDFIAPELKVAQIPSTPGVSPWSELSDNSGMENSGDILIDFTERINENNLYDAISISPLCNYYITTSIEGSDPNFFTRARIVFIEPMESEKYYTLLISSTVTDLQQNALKKDYIFHFITDGTGSISPVVNVIGDGNFSGANPINQWQMGEVQPLAYNVDGGGNTILSGIKIVFQNRINPNTIDVAIEKTSGPSGGSVKMNNNDWPIDGNGNQFYAYQFDIKDIYEGSIYKITVRGGKTGLKDENGNFMKDDFVQFIRF